MGRIIAISSGNLTSTMPINKYALTLIGKPAPSFLFIPTASHDAADYIENMRVTYADLVGSFESLNLATREYSSSELADMISRADIIYVGGGDTIFMMEMWRKYGVDRLLREVFEKDSAVLTGISAGALCWFQRGHSDSIPGPQGLTYGMTGPLLGILPYAFCPHYEDPERKVFETQLRNNEKGLALESNVAFVHDGDEEYFVRSQDGAKGYRIETYAIKKEILNYKTFT